MPSARCLDIRSAAAGSTSLMLGGGLCSPKVSPRIVQPRRCANVIRRRTLSSALFLSSLPSPLAARALALEREQQQAKMNPEPPQASPKSQAGWAAGRLIVSFQPPRMQLSEPRRRAVKYRPQDAWRLQPLRRYIYYRSRARSSAHFEHASISCPASPQQKHTDSRTDWNGGGRGARRGSRKGCWAQRADGRGLPRLRTGQPFRGTSSRSHIMNITRN